MKALLPLEDAAKLTRLRIIILIIYIQNIFISYLNTLSDESFTKLSTVLYKWNCHRKKRWLFPPKQKSKPGRPPISMKIRKLIIEIKKLNHFWGIRRISGELAKIDIEVSKDTVRRVIQKGRKDGDILPTGSWKKFINAHIQSLFCCDFLSIDTVFTKRIYITDNRHWE